MSALRFNDVSLMLDRSHPSCASKDYGMLVDEDKRLAHLLYSDGAVTPTVASWHCDVSLSGGDVLGKPK